MSESAISTIIGILGAFGLAGVLLLIVFLFAACSLSQKADDVEEARFEAGAIKPCEACGSAGDVTCEECRAVHDGSAK